MKRVILGIDPGLAGAFVLTNGADIIRVWKIPLFTCGKEKTVSYSATEHLLKRIRTEFGCVHVYLERAVPFAMGAKSAFNYGRGFEKLVIAIERLGFPMTLVEPLKWTREMHEGIKKDLNPKARSLIAVRRLYPQFVGNLPKKLKGQVLDGPVDALLIAGYGLRRLSIEPDFF